MFEKEEEFNIPLLDCLKVGMVSYNINSVDLSTNIEQQIYNLTKKRLEFIYTNNIADLYKHQEQTKEDEVKGLLSKQWMNNVMNCIPSIIVVHYHIKIGANKELEEKNIFQMLEDIRKYSNTCTIIFIVISKDMQERPYNFNYDDKAKPYCIKKYMNKNHFFIFQIEEIWKTNEFKNIYTQIYLNSRNFYGQYKKKYKDKREKTKIREERIDYDIKLGVLSLMKSKANKKNKFKYFNEAYELLSDKKFDVSNYLYGNKNGNIQYNFYEIRAIADWIFFKSPNIKNALFHELMKMYKKHISCFNYLKIYNEGKKDYFLFIEYYWLYKRYKNLSDSIEIIINNGKVRSKNNLISFGIILFKQVYFLIKMIKLHDIIFNAKDFDFSSILINNQKIDIKDIEEKESICFGKPPSYYILDKENSNNTISIDISFNDEIYIKKFIINKKICKSDIIDILKNDYFNKIIAFFSKLKSNDLLNNDSTNNNNNLKNMKGINLYINILKIISLNDDEKNEKYFENSEISDAIINLYKTISNSKQIKKFTKVYINFIKQYINVLQFKLKQEKGKESPDSKINYYKTELFKNLSILGNLRKFELEEENLFYEIYNDGEFIPLSIFPNSKGNIIINLNYYNKGNVGIINCDNLAFNFNYSIIDIDKHKQRKIFDLIEYEIKFNSSLSKEKIKLNSLKLIFKYINEDNKKKEQNSESIIKEFNKNDLDKYELGQQSCILILYKLLLKKQKGKLYLNKVIFNLCKKENIFYEINIPSELDKTILLTGKSINVLNFKYPKKLTSVGINQLFTFEYEIKKQKVNKIKIIDYKMSYEQNDISKPQKSKMKKDMKNLNIDELNNDDNRSRKKVAGSFHTKNIQINEKDDSSLNFMIGNAKERKMSFHKKKLVNDSPSAPFFYAYDEKSNSIKEYKNYLEIRYNNLESKLEKEENKFSILIKFCEYGLYKIKLKIKYLIRHEELGDIMEFNRENIFFFKVINPFKLSNNINSENYISFTKNTKTKNNDKLKEYLTDTNIKINLYFNNILGEDAIIKNIKIIPNEILSNRNRLEINSTIKEIIENKDIEEVIKEDILKIFKFSSYTIPFEFKFYKSFYGSLGKCQIFWITDDLKNYRKDKNNNDNLCLYNINEYEFPNINVNLLELKYNYEKNYKDSLLVLNIKIQNKSKFNKTLIIRIENNDENIIGISGLLKKKIYLISEEIMKFTLKLIVLQKGEVKLPSILINELDKKGQELLTNYYCPEKILFNN